MAMQEIKLPGLRVVLEQPRQLREGVGHLWFPSLAQFPTGDLMLSAILTPDTNENLVDAYCVSTSRDGGETWAPFYDVAGWGGGCIPRIEGPDGALAGPDFYLFPDPPGQWRRFCGHYERFEEGGRRYVREPWAVHVEGLPRDVCPLSQAAKWGQRYPANFVFYGHAVDLSGIAITATELTYQGDTHCTQIALTSADQGRTWHYLAEVASPETVPNTPEGPTESSLIQLADGDLMCVMRVGADSNWPLVRSYSADRGKTWSAVDRLPAYSVAPCMRRLDNDVIALSTGRPGIYLWLSTDPRGTSWQSIDILAHHNAVLDESHQIRSGSDYVGAQSFQTTSYTEIVEVSPGRLLLVYDRIPFGWKHVPTDSDERNRIYILPIEVQRV